METTSSEEALPESIGSLSALQRLSLDFNRLRKLPEAFGQLRQCRQSHRFFCEDLWLTGNQLQTLPDTFGGLTKLQQLRLGRNRLRELPESFGQLCSLKLLALEECISHGYFKFV
eukprot:g12658.t1